MYIDGEKIESVEIKDKKIKIVIIADAKDVIDKGGLNYELKKDLEKEITGQLAKWIIENYGKEIKEQVLKDVNWAELTRNEVVRDTLKKIVSGQNY